MSPIRAVLAGVVAAALPAVAGCQSTASDHTFGTPTPPYNGVETTDGSTPTSEDALYVEAEQIVRKIRAEILKVQRAGGADSLPSEFDPYVTGELAATFAAEFKEWKDNEWVVYGRSETDEWFRPDPEGGRNGSLVSVAVCTDGRDAQMSEQGTPVSRGRVAINYYYFKYFDGQLMAFAIDSEWVGSC